MDSSSNVKGKDEILLIDLEGPIIKHSLHFGFQALNNKTAYKVLIAELKLSNIVGAQRVKVHNDLQLGMKR